MRVHRIASSHLFTPRWRKGGFLWTVVLAFTLCTIATASSVAAHEGHREDRSVRELVRSVSPDDAVNVVVAEEQSQFEGDRDDQAFDPVDFVGRLHPAAVHFPIALLIFAAFGEILLILRPAWGLETTVRFLTVGGAAGAIIAAALGWFAGGFRLSDRSELLSWHRWIGTGIAVAAVIAAILVLRGNRVRICAPLLGMIAAVLVVQGYLGGELSLGPGHLGFEK